MNKITVKEFCKEYAQRPDNTKDSYIRENLKINPYVPFIKKDAIIENLLKITMIDKETGNIKQNSSAEYLLLTRIFMEQYTNLKVETEGFYEEYDELKKSGLFDILFIGNEETKVPPLVPYEEMAEFKYLLAQKKADLITNKYEIHSYINEQVERFGSLFNAVVEPFMESIQKKIEDIPEEDIKKAMEMVKNGDFREVKGR